LVQLLEEQGVMDQRVLQALRTVPRHEFVPDDVRSMAYADRPLPIGHGQTISQPYIVAAMTEAAAPEPTSKCLEIGTGSGYQAAVLAEVCGEVYSIEYLPMVAKFGERNLRRLGYGPKRVHLRVGDGYQGWPSAAPFDVVVVTAAPEKVPPPLLQQLAVGGRLVIPVGPEDDVQFLERWTRARQGSGPDALDRDRLMGVRFVPFLGDAAARD
jgi:protein-L-isoaspartate(D-aspartate) O-methyltransferase